MPVLYLCTRIAHLEVTVGLLSFQGFSFFNFSSRIFTITNFFYSLVLFTLILKHFYLLEVTVFLFPLASLLFSAYPLASLFSSNFGNHKRFFAFWSLCISTSQPFLLLSLPLPHPTPSPTKEPVLTPLGAVVPCWESTQRMSSSLKSCYLFKWPPIILCLDNSNISFNFLSSCKNLFPCIFLAIGYLLLTSHFHFRFSELRILWILFLFNFPSHIPIVVNVNILPVP